MALPLKSWFTIFNAIGATTTARVPDLGNQHPEHANSIILEIVAATAPSWTLDIQGRTHPDGTYLAVDYIQIWQAGIAAFANSQLSITDTTRRFYLIPNCPPFLQLIGTFTAGTLTIRGCYTSEVFAQWLVTGARGEIRVGGDVANNSVDAGNPLKVGGKARTALPTAVAASARVDAMFDVYGRQVTVPYVAGAGEVTSLLHDLVTNSTTRQTVVTPTSGKKIRIIAYSINNQHATTQFSVEIYFATGANIESTKANAIARHSIVATGSSTQEGHFPAGAGPIGAADAVLSTRTNTDSLSNVFITVHYREE